MIREVIICCRKVLKYADIMGEFGTGRIRKSPEDMKNAIISMIKKDKQISRKYMAEVLEVSEKAITRYIKEIPNVKYVGKGKNGYWEVN